FKTLFDRSELFVGDENIFPSVVSNHIIGNNFIGVYLTDLLAKNSIKKLRAKVIPVTASLNYSRHGVNR
ncbi:MAG: hypothetical protein IJG24_06520, partial [Selenomonadaceae bacterium]|nr:hypothetical protein [Selenomonadaceae bacterium]